MTDTFYTHCNVVNSGIIKPNLTKFLHTVDKLLPINVLKLELRY